MLESNQARRIAFATLAAGALLLRPSAARAEEVSPTGKGIVGGALLGGEVVVFAEALFGVRSTTAYLVGAGGGAVAGGIGGYFVEQGVSDGHVPAYLLAGGLALVIPAVVITLDQTRYLPTEGAREDRPVTNLPPSDPGKPGGSAVIGAEVKPEAAPTPAPSPPPAPSAVPPTAPPAGGGGGGTPSPARAPMSLLQWREGDSGLRFRVGLPVPEVRPVFTAAQQKTFAVTGSGSEVRLPVVHVTF